MSKYYVVSEEELRGLCTAVACYEKAVREEDADMRFEFRSRLSKMETAVRSLPVVKSELMSHAWHEVYVEET